MLWVGPLADVAGISWAGQLDASTLCTQYFSLAQLFPIIPVHALKHFGVHFL
jgi:hypothetical protein